MAHVTHVLCDASKFSRFLEKKFRPRLFPGREII